MIAAREAEETWPRFLDDWRNGKPAARYEQAERTDMSRVPAPRLDLLKMNRYVDPLTAMLVPGALTDAACKGTVRVFDGRQRFDVALAFKRMGQAKAKDGYAGPALVCSGKYKPIAGKGESAFMPSFISDYLAGQEPEVILAPLSGTRLLGLFRVSLNTVVGSIVVQATQFKALAR